MITPKRASRKANRREFKPQVGVESLGERVMLSGITATLSATGTLRVVGTDAADDLTVKQMSNKYSVVGVTIEAEPQWIINGQGQITQLGGPHSSVPSQAVKRIEVEAKAGDDVLRIYNTGAGMQPIKVPITMWCGEGDDTVYGGYGPDSVYADGGDDQVSGFDGNDWLLGDTGEDTLFSGKGNDTVIGSDGADSLDGGDGTDTLSGGDGDDTAFGAAGNDVLWGHDGEDHLKGGIGNDKLYGHDDDDLLEGEIGNDFACGMEGDDTLIGDSGLDTLMGDAGDDRIEGGPDKDTLNGNDGEDLILSVGGGQDKLAGGDGIDSFWGDAVGGGSAVADTISDVNAWETAMGSVHLVDQFVFDYTGGILPGTVSKEPLGQDMPDPFAKPGNLSLVDFSNVALFGPDGPQADHIDQNGLADCYFLATLSGLAAERSGVIVQSVVDLGDGTYAVRLYRDGAPVYYRVDGELYSSNGTTSTYAGVSPVLWPAILEKAWAFHRDQDGDYASIEFGSSGEVADAFNRPHTPMPDENFADAAAMADWIDAQLSTNKIVMVSGPGSNSDWTLPQGSSTAHLLWACDINASKTQVRIRNPWGGNNAYAWIDIDDMFRRTGGFRMIN